MVFTLQKNLGIAEGILQGLMVFTHQKMAGQAKKYVAQKSFEKLVSSGKKVLPTLFVLILGK